MDDLDYSDYYIAGVSFHPARSSCDTLKNIELGDSSLVICSFTQDVNTILAATATTTRYVSAKIVVVGETNVGKSCLALRLVEDHYQEQGTTHVMRLWSMPPERLSATIAAPIGEQREVVLWDLGGQTEYRLVQQLFLHDTTLALLLLDPTRGQKAFADVEEWNVRLEKQLRGRKATKLLVGTKLDDEEQTSLIDRAGLDCLLKISGSIGFYLTSAKVPRGIDELREAIAQAIDWSELSQTTRPLLFQRIREAVTERQQKGEAVLLYTELEQQIRQALPEQFDPAAVDTVVNQLALQGSIANTRLASGERALVLQVGLIERYAGSLIVAVRNNPRGVPALEVAEAIGMKSLPGIKDEERLHPFQERIVLECMVQLLLEHGICLKHEGLLIFPSLFPQTVAGEQVNIAQTVSLYYDFSGAIDNIYSSLVVKLALSDHFGRVRFWKDRAEYERPDQGLCGLRKVDRHGGWSHLDLLFGERTSPETHDLFTVFVEQHLSHEGVDIKEVLGMICGACGYGFDEALVRKRIDRNQMDMICPECETRLPITRGAKEARASNPEIAQELFALKTIIEQKRNVEVSKVKRAFVQGKPDETDPIRILHLSDLHFSKQDDPITKLQPLESDLQDSQEGLGFDHLDYLVVSGDLTNHASGEEFDRVYNFISSLIERFRITAERCVIVPGNHDLSWNQKVYDWEPKRSVNPTQLKSGSYIERNDVYLIRDDSKYPSRFENFGKFYHELLQQPYPLGAEGQCLPFLFENTGVQFLAMNSAWEIDEFYPDRSSINDSALSAGLQKARQQIEDARKHKRMAADAKVLRIAVWHHPVTGNDKIVNDAFLGRLRQADIKLCLHGHVHEDRADLVGYLHPTRSLHIAGAGSFGAPTHHRPESTPRLYNVLEVWRDHSKIRVHTRCLRKGGGAWEGWAVWPNPADSSSRRTYYEI